MIRLIRYSPEMAPEWDRFVTETATNATFLHRRGYMDYHSDRFADCSLMAYDDKGRLMAVLPANIEGTVLWTHHGLTYGGWLTANRHFDSGAMLRLWDEFVAWMRSEGITELIYKAVPHIFQRYPSDDDLYALFRLGAVQNEAIVSSALPLDRPVLMNSASRWRASRTRRKGIVIGRDDDYEGFMSILADRLDERYGATPVHTLAEIRLLSSRFPENIRLITARTPDGELLAGTVVYVTDTVTHAQYIATTAEGRRLGVFAAIVDYLIEHECAGRQWLDFGGSCEDGGRVLNDGLNAQKYGYGGRPLLYQTLRLTL